MKAYSPILFSIFISFSFSHICYSQINLDSLEIALDDKITLASKARNKGKIDSSFIFINEVITEAKKHNLNKKIIYAYLNLGGTFRQIGNMDSCGYYYDKSLTLASEIKDTFFIASSYNAKGNVEHISGNFDKAIEYYNKSLEYKRLLNDMRGVAIGHLNVAQIQAEVDDLEKAKIGFSKALKIAEKENLPRLVVHSLVKLGSTNRKTKNYNKAVINHKKALKLAVESKQKKQELAARYQLGEDYLEQEDFVNAYKSQNNALQISRELKHKAYQSAILTSIGKIYMKNDESQDMNSLDIRPSTIGPLLLEANKLAIESGSIDSKMDATEALIYFYEKQNDHKNLAAYQKDFIILQDTVFASDRIASISEWESKYNNAEQELKIVKLENEKEVAELRESIFKWTIFGILVGFSLLSILGYKYIKVRNERVRLEEANEFRSSISHDLHDEVGSLLTALAMQSEMLAATADSGQSSKLSKLSLLSRNAMARMRDMVWSIDSRRDNSKDLRLKIKEYLHEILPPLDKKYNFTFDSDETKLALTPVVRQNIFLIFKEAIANAIKHSNGDKIDVNFSDRNSVVNLQILDNGTTNNNIESTGSGLMNMRNRAEKINGIIKIDNKSGYKISLEVPI